MNHSGCPWYYINLFSYLIGFGAYWFGYGRIQYKNAIELEVEKRVAARLSQHQDIKPSVQQSTTNIKHLESRLIQLLQGDRNAALRLVQHIKAQHPKQGALWCWEKAIQDLERDRL